MLIRVLAVGKIKESYLVEAIREYQKRLSRYCRLEILSVPDEMTPQDASPAQEEQIKRIEGERLLKLIRERDTVIALALDGSAPDSVGLSRKLEGYMVGGVSTIDFCIGGSLGLSDEVLRRADERISFSRLTFPHQLMQVILLEQIYRSFKIMHHEPYHK